MICRPDRDPQRNLTLGPFLTSYLAGCVPVHVASASFYDAIASSRGDLRFHFASFAHDLTVHALNYHLVPRASIETFRDCIERTMPERVAHWKEPGSSGPLTLTTFFDNDLNRYGYAVWSRCEAPEHFARLFAETRNHGQILDCLDRRIDETLRGLGDVPGGDTRDMPPLIPCEFQIAG